MPYFVRMAPVGPTIALRGVGGVTALAFRPTGRQAAIGRSALIQFVDVPQPMSGEPGEVRRQIERLIGLEAGDDGAAAPAR